MATEEKQSKIDDSMMDDEDRQDINTPSNRYSAIMFNRFLPLILFLEVARSASELNLTNRHEDRAVQQRISYGMCIDIHHQTFFQIVVFS